MPTSVVNTLADMSLADAVFLAVALFVAGGSVCLLLIDAKRLVPKSLRPLVKRSGVRVALAAARARLAVVAWLLRRLDSSTPAPQKGDAR